MILWRISNYADLLGIGGMTASARWHTAGQPILYLAETPSSALLEVFVHLETDEDHWPDAYQLLKIEADDGVDFESVELSSLSPVWKSDELETRAIGDAWLPLRKTSLLRVPSAITPETWNWVLNPRHADAPRLRIVHTENTCTTLGFSNRELVSLGYFSVPRCEVVYQVFGTGKPVDAVARTGLILAGDRTGTYAIRLVT